MNNFLRLLLGACLTGLASMPAALAEPAADAEVARLQAQALASPLAFDLLSSLTTDVGPRMAGTEGDRRAVAWAEQRFRELGFDRVWKEPVEFPLWVRREERAAVVVPRLQPMAVTALGGSPGTGGLVNAEVVHFASLEDLQAASPDSVQGRIVFISGRMQRSRNGSGYGAAVGARTQGPMVAASLGARALLIRSIGTSNNRLAHTGNISSTTPGERVPSAAISNPDADLLEALLASGQPVSVELLLDCGYEGTGSSYNVIAEFDGDGESDQFVMVGGHLDSWDLGTGAHDNAAGVATTMAAAQLVAAMPGAPRRGIRVVLFANEEQGIYGGKAYAEQHAQALSRHAIGAEADLGAGRVYAFRSRVAPPAMPAVAQLEQWLAPLEVPYQPKRQATGGADLGQMRRLGMPMIDLRLDATDYFDYHHNANDTLDKIDPAALAHNVAAFSTFLYWATRAAVDFGPLAPSD